MPENTSGPRLPPKPLFKAINPVMKGILRSPLHRLVSKRLILLTFTGRRSGMRYSTPVGYVTEGDDLWLSNESVWKKNLGDNAPVSVRLRGKDRTGTTTVLSSPEDLRSGFKTILEQALQFGRIAAIGLRAGGLPMADAIARARAAGFVIVRVHLTPA